MTVTVRAIFAAGQISQFVSFPEFVGDQSMKIDAGLIQYESMIIECCDDSWCFGDFGCGSNITSC